MEKLRSDDVNKMIKKWKGFGWHTIKCDSHNISKITQSLQLRKKKEANCYSKNHKKQTYHLWKTIMISIMVD